MDGAVGWQGAEQHDVQARESTPHDATMSAVEQQSGEETPRSGSDHTANALVLPSPQAMVEACPLPMVTVDPDGVVMSWNQAAEQVFGWSEAELLGAPLPLIPPGMREEADSWHVQVRQGEAISEVDTCWLRKDGTPIDLLLSWAPLRDEESRITGSLLVCVDISERKRREEMLTYHAFHDPLTGLPNRMLFRDRLEQSLRSAHRHGTPFAVLLLDLDRLKEINDTLGHGAGDLLLQQVAQRLQGTLRESDTAARLGGDEFAVLLVNTDERGARRTAEKVSQVVQRPMMVEGRALEVRLSIGVGLYTDREEDAASLLRGADRAMYTAKRLHQEYAVYSGG